MEYIIAAFALSSLPLVGLALGSSAVLMFTSHHSRRH